MSEEQPDNATEDGVRTLRNMIINYTNVAGWNDDEILAFGIIMFAELVACSNMNEEQIEGLLARTRFHIYQLKASLKEKEGDAQTPSS